MRIKDVLKWIEEDIEYQRTNLQDDFQLDKPIRWRIIGLNKIKDRILDGIKEEVRDEKYKKVKKSKEKRDFYLAGSFLFFGFAIADLIYIQSLGFIITILVALFLMELKEQEEKIIKKLKGGKNK